MDPLFAKYGEKAGAGQILFSQGDKGNKMYVIRKGYIRVFVNSNGIEKTLALLGPGEFLGEMAILGERPRTASAVVEEDSDLLVIGRNVMEDMLKNNTEIALRLIRKLSGRLEAADSLIQVLLHRDPRERVIENLKRLAGLHRDDSKKEVSIAADCEAMAEQVGLKVDEVHDIISRLIRADALSESEGLWKISNLAKLSDYLEFLKEKEKYK